MRYLNMKRIICVFCAIFGLLSVNAEVKLPAIFSNGMVLQQQTTARLWGWSSKKNVTVTTSWDTTRLPPTRTDVLK